MILLMEEFLHQLIGSIGYPGYPDYPIIYISSGAGFSSINSMSKGVKVTYPASGCDDHDDMNDRLHQEAGSLLFFVVV